MKKWHYVLLSLIVCYIILSNYTITYIGVAQCWITMVMGAFIIARPDFDKKKDKDKDKDNS